MTGVAKMTQNGNLSKGPCFWKHHRIQSPRHPPRSFMLVQAHETLNTNRRQSQYNLIFPTEIYSTEYKIRSTWNHVWKCLKLYPNAECKKMKKNMNLALQIFDKQPLGNIFSNQSCRSYARAAAFQWKQCLVPEVTQGWQWHATRVPSRPTKGCIWGMTTVHILILSD
jgi:hypothetical protein